MRRGGDTAPYPTSLVNGAMLCARFDSRPGLSVRNNLFDHRRDSLAGIIFSMLND